jgi:hypothetical protein
VFTWGGGLDIASCSFTIRWPDGVGLRWIDQINYSEFYDSEGQLNWQLDMGTQDIFDNFRITFMYELN